MSNENVKNKLVNSMRATKAGTAKSTTASEQKAESPSKSEKPKKATAPRKSSSAASGYTSTGYSSGCRIWPD